MKRFFRFSGLILTLYFGVGLFIYLQQDNLLYHPTAKPNFPLPPHLVLKHQQQTINVWRQEAKNNRAVIYFGGNGEATERTMDYLAPALPELDAYFMSYRGYSGSSGKASEQANITDALALYDELAKMYDHISVIGRSLGSAIAISVASQRKLDKLVLVTPYDSIADIAQGRYQWLPVHWLIRDSYRAIDWVSLIDSPVLIYTAEKDDVIPAKNSQALIQAFNPSQALSRIQLKGVGHNNLTRHPYCLVGLHAFLVTVD